MSRQFILTAIILQRGATYYFRIMCFKCIQLIYQVLAELPFLNDNFQMNYKKNKAIDLGTAPKS